MSLDLQIICSTLLHYFKHFEPNLVMNSFKNGFDNILIYYSLMMNIQYIQLCTHINHQYIIYCIKIHKENTQNIHFKLYFHKNTLSNTNIFHFEIQLAKKSRTHHRYLKYKFYNLSKSPNN